MSGMLLMPLGILFPGSVLHSDFFAILAAFVAINTVIYAALAIAKIVPILRLADLRPGGGFSRRSATRSIYPETPPDAAPTHPRQQ